MTGVNGSETEKEKIKTFINDPYAHLSTFTFRRRCCRHRHIYRCHCRRAEATAAASLAPSHK
jgi:hypothetical protein